MKPPGSDTWCGARMAAPAWRRPQGDVRQWDMWQAGMGLVDFTFVEAIGDIISHDASK
jgi:hypothetical protein